MRNRLFTCVLLTCALAAAAIVGAGTAAASQSPAAPSCEVVSGLKFGVGTGPTFAHGFAACNAPVELGVEVTVEDATGKQLGKHAQYCGYSFECYGETSGYVVPNQPYCAKTLAAYRVAPGQPLIYLADSHCEISAI